MGEWVIKFFSPGWFPKTRLLFWPKIVFDCQFFQKIKLIIIGKFQVKTIKVCRNIKVLLRVSKIWLYEKVKSDGKKLYSVDLLDKIVSYWKWSTILNNFFSKDYKTHIENYSYVNVLTKQHFGLKKVPIKIIKWIYMRWGWNQTFFCK